jgi:hypothetical protein
LPTKLRKSIGRALRGSTRPSTELVHFHLGSDGRPFVCDVHACDSAAVTTGELQLIPQQAR